MKHCLAAILAALALVIAAPGAFATRVIFDPPTTPQPLATSTTDCTHSDPCNISVLDQAYHVEFLPCAQALGVSTTGYNWCLWMNNVTGQAAAHFTFSFFVPAGGADSGDQLTCGSIPDDLATNDCPQTLPPVGELFTVSFFAQPPLSNRTDFYLFTDFVNSPGSAEVTLSNSAFAVPEPGSLGVFGLGLLALVAGLGLKRHHRAP